MLRFAVALAFSLASLASLGSLAAQPSDLLIQPNRLPPRNRTAQFDRHDKSITAGDFGLLGRIAQHIIPPWRQNDFTRGPNSIAVARPTPV